MKVKCSSGAFFSLSFQLVRFVQYRGVACDDDEEADRCESLPTGWVGGIPTPPTPKGGGNLLALPRTTRTNIAGLL